MSSCFGTRSQFLNREVAVGIDANFAGDAHRFQRDILGGELGVLRQAARGSQGERAARTDGAYAVVGLDHISVTGYDKRAFGICDNEKRLEVAKRAILAPFLGQLDSRLGQVAVMLLKLALEPLEQRKRVGG